MVTSHAPDVFADIDELHRVFVPDQIAERPTTVRTDVRVLRQRLIAEEFVELIDAMKDQNLSQIADGIADMIVVLLGTAVAYGIDMRPIWQLVHASNMAKLGGDGRPIFREDGKFLKPLGWKAPDLEAEISRQIKMHFALSRPRLHEDAIGHAGDRP